MNEDDLYQALGKSVAARRKALNKTQADIATKISLSRASLANIERGNQKVLLHQVYRLAEALELPDVRDLIPLAPVNNGLFTIDNIPIHGMDNGLTDIQKIQIDAFVTKSGPNPRRVEE